MPLTPLHSVSTIIRALLIGLGQGSDVVNNAPAGPWPVYRDNEPPGQQAADDCVTVYRTSPEKQGRTNPDGETLFHHGFQVRVRSVLPDDGARKADAIVAALDGVQMTYVPVGGNNYLVPAVSNTGVIDLRRGEAPASRLRVYTINCTSAIRRVNAPVPPNAYYPLDGSLVDGTGLGNDLTPASPVYGSGLFGQALVSGGGSVSPQFIYSGPVTPNNPMSFSGWFLAPSLPTTGWTFLQIGDTAAGPALTLAAGRSGFHITVTITLYGDNSQSNSSVYFVDPSEWYHLAVIWDGTTFTLYFNGQNRGSGTLVTTAAWAGGLTLTANSGSNARWMDDLAFPRTLFSPADVAYLWNFGAGNPYPLTQN